MILVPLTNLAYKEVINVDPNKSKKRVTYGIIILAIPNSYMTDFE